MAIIKNIDHAKNIGAYFRRLPLRLRIFWVAYAPICLLQIFWFFVAYFIGSDSDGVRSFVNSELITSITDIFSLLALVVINFVIIWVLYRKSADFNLPSPRIEHDLNCENNSLVCTHYQLDRWDMHHGDNIYILTYDTREKAVYEKHVEVIPLRDNLREFRDGTYTWTGDEKKGPRVLEAGCVLELREVFLKRVYFIRLDPYTIIEKDKHFKYTINVDLEDSNHKARALNSFTIRRPISSVTFVVKIHKDIPTKDNFIAVALEEYGESVPFINETPESKREGDYHVYTYRFDNPRLFCEYGIMWDWYE